MQSIIETLRKLVKAPGPSGFEEEVANVFVNEIADFVDEIEIDTLGNVVAVKKGVQKNGPKLMLAAHLDEVSFIVKHVDDKGWVYFDILGFADDRTLPGQLVTLYTKNGPIQGVVGIKGKLASKPEELVKSVPISDMWIDVGVNNKEEIQKLGIRVGDPITFSKRFDTFGCENMVYASSLDDRLGCTVLVETLKRLKKEDHEATIYAVGTVQEEIGCKGAKVVANAIDPDLALILDTTVGDDPATSDKDVPIKVGGGPTIRLMDENWSAIIGHITPPKVKELIIQVAESEKIPYQLDVLGKVATDASAVHLSGRGVLTGTILVPRRYFHTPLEVANLIDVENAILLTTAVVKRINSSFIKSARVRIK